MQQQRWDRNFRLHNFSVLATFTYWSKTNYGFIESYSIVPISSTLDTPGPMTKNITDSGILLSAMSGQDTNDPATKNSPQNIQYLDHLKTGTLKGLRFGAIKTF
jgi:amidase